MTSYYSMMISKIISIATFVWLSWKIQLEVCYYILHLTSHDQGPVLSHYCTACRALHWWFFSTNWLCRKFGLRRGRRLGFFILNGLHFSDGTDLKDFLWFPTSSCLNVCSWLLQSKLLGSKHCDSYTFVRTTHLWDKEEPIRPENYECSWAALIMPCSIQFIVTYLKLYFRDSHIKGHALTVAKDMIWWLNGIVTKWCH